MQKITTKLTISLGRQKTQTWDSVILDLLSVRGKMHQAFHELIKNHRDPRALIVILVPSLIYSCKVEEKNTVFWDARLSQRNGAPSE